MRELATEGPTEDSAAVNRPADHGGPEPRRIGAKIVLNLATVACGRVAGGGSDGNSAGAVGGPMLDGPGVIGHGTHTQEEHLLSGCLEPRTRLKGQISETLRPALVAGVQPGGSSAAI